MSSLDAFVYAIGPIAGTSASIKPILDMLLVPGDIGRMNLIANIDGKPV